MEKKLNLERKMMNEGGKVVSVPCSVFSGRQRPEAGGQSFSFSVFRCFGRTVFRSFGKTVGRWPSAYAREALPTFSLIRRGKPA
jgi:hypothetical protein